MGAGEAFIHSSLQVFPLRQGSNLLNCSLCKCYANDHVSTAQSGGEGEGWADSLGFTSAPSLPSLPSLPPGEEPGGSSDNPVLGAERAETRLREKQRKAPSRGELDSLLSALIAGIKKAFGNVRRARPARLLCN